MIIGSEDDVINENNGSPFDTTPKIVVLRGVLRERSRW